MALDDAPGPARYRVAVSREVDVVLCQSRARAFAASLGFDRRAQWEIAIAVSEAVSNILKYAGKGVLVLRAVNGDPGWLEFEASDEGRGIADVVSAQRDGISNGWNITEDPRVATRSGLGLGFGAMRRLMDSLEVVSSPAGTIVRARRRRV